MGKTIYELFCRGRGNETPVKAECLVRSIVRKNKHRDLFCHCWCIFLSWHGPLGSLGCVGLSLCGSFSHV